MRNVLLRLIQLIVPAIVLASMLSVAGDASGQTSRRRRNPPAIPVASPTPPATEPEVISRADEVLDTDPQAIRPEPVDNRPVGADTTSVQSLEELGMRIRNLEAGRKPDTDEKKKRLLLNLDILTRAEQRSETLRKQLFEMIEKENTVKTKLDSLEYDLRPEAIDRSTAMVGSLRPEEIRASRRKSLESEKANLQTLLTEIQKNRTAVDLNLQRADALVERLRVKLEKEIDTAIADDPEENEN